MTPIPALSRSFRRASGSKRVPGKNVRLLGGHPVIAYTIAPALESGVFESVIVSTDSEEIAAIARHYGAEVPFLRPAAFAGDTSPDIEWLEHTLARAAARRAATWDCFSLLRPTSPFRTADTIRRAWTRFIAQDGVDSLRAVEKCAQHPGKMWVVRGDRMCRCCRSDTARAAVAQHAVPGAAAGLRAERVARDRLDARRVRAAHDRRRRARAVSHRGLRGFDINDPHDWMVAERLLADGAVHAADASRKRRRAVGPACR